MALILNPNVSVGEFVFNDDISKYEDKYDFEIESEDESGYEEYSIEEPETSLFVEEGKIGAVACYEECIYKERNIIGMTIEEFIAHSGAQHHEDVEEAEYDDDEESEFIYEFESLGIQVWEQGEGGKIVTVIASIYEDYDDEEGDDE